MTTDAARKAVFNTPELLENIISFVSPTDILTKVQRLSRQWKDAVDSSRVIKTQLWLRVPNVTPTQPSNFTEMDEQSVPAWFFWGTLGMPIYSHAVAVNPVVLKGVQGSLKIYLDEELQHGPLEKSNDDLLHSKVVDFGHDELSGQSSGSALGPRGSWRDMYLTDPPITAALLLVCNYDDLEEEFGPRVIKVVVRDNDGLSLGLVHDNVVAALPLGVREKLRNTRFLFIGSLCIALRWRDMSATAH